MTESKNIVTPAGQLVYPYLKSPDVKFDDDGVWKTQLRLKGAEAENLKALIDKEVDEAVSEFSEKKNKKVKRGNAPYKIEEDVSTLFNFKLKASGVRPDGSKWTQKPVLYDSKGNLINGAIHVWGGSTGKVAFLPVRYHTSLIGASVSLRMKAVQILNLVEGGEGASASSYGFSTEESGYETSNDTATVEAVANEKQVEDF